MSVETGPNIVNSGLVFNLDASNIRSFQGVARTNLARGVNYNRSNTNTSTYKYTQGTEVVDIPQVGKRTVKYADHWNDYNGGSGDCCPSLFYYHDGWVSVSGSTTYTYSLIYKTTTGYTHPNFMYRYEYVNASTYVTEGGVHNDNNRTHLGDGWYYAWGQFTTQPTTNTLILYLFYYQYATWDRIYVDRASLVAGSTVPDIKHITDYNSTNSGNWTDTTGGYTGTLTNGPTYDSANGGSIVFDGSNDYIDLGTTLSTQFSSNAVTVSCFAKISSVVSKNTLISFNGAFNFFLPGNRLTTTYQLYWDSTSSWKNGTKSDWNTNQWYNLVWTISGTTLTFYVDGVVNGTATLSTSFAPSSSTRIGFANAGEYATGNIANLQLYNRALTAAEVTQNFNATRARFGV